MANFNWWHNKPYAEEYQQAAYNGFPFLPEFGTRRLAPAEEPFITWRPGGVQGRGWYQGKRKLHGFKSKKVRCLKSKCCCSVEMLISF